MLLAIARCSGITDYALVCLRKRGIKDRRLHNLAGQPTNLRGQIWRQFVWHLTTSHFSREHALFNRAIGIILMDPDSSVSFVAIKLEVRA